jgi:hypothetical protein
MRPKRLSLARLQTFDTVPKVLPHRLEVNDPPGRENSLDAVCMLNALSDERATLT